MGEVNTAGRRWSSYLAGGVVALGVGALALLVAGCTPGDGPGSPGWGIDDPYTEGDFSAGLARTGESPVTFTEVAASLGIGGVQADKRFPPDCLFNDLWPGPQGCIGERTTGGVAVGDANSDGLDDLYLTRLDGPDSLYLNNGDGTFTDATEAAGLGGFDFRSNGAGFADLTNDGHQDLVVTTVAEDRFYLFINNGDGTFTEEAVERGVALESDDPRGGYSVAFGDYDNDGWVDIHLTEWLDANTHTVPSATHARLLRNRGAEAPGVFEDVSAAAGVQVGKDMVDSTGLSEFTDPVFSFASVFVDIDGDGFVDLVVSGDYGTSQLFWNNGDGTFTDGTAQAGFGTEGNAMGLAVGDVTGDGNQDLFITAIAGRADACQGRPCPDNLTGNRLYLHNGDRTFTEFQGEADVADGAWGWGAAALDFDNDGKLDLVMTNGVDFDLDDEFTEYHGPYRLSPKRLWHNDGSGIFTEVAASAGIDVAIPGTGLAVADLTGNGYPDIIMVHPHDAPTVWRNNGGTDNAWLRIQVAGAGPEAGGSNLDGLGAIVEVTARPGDPPQVRHVGINSHFLGQSERTVHVGLGDPGNLDNGEVAEVRVFFPASGREVVRRNVAVNEVLRITEPSR
jgi:hypothetical protein